MFATVHYFSSRLRGPLDCSVRRTVHGEADLSGSRGCNCFGVCSVVPLKYNARPPIGSARKLDDRIELVRTGRKPLPEFGRLLHGLVLCMDMHQTPQHEISYFLVVSWAPGECGTHINCWLADYAGMTLWRQGFFKCIRPVESIAFSISGHWLLIHQTSAYLLQQALFSTRARHQSTEIASTNLKFWIFINLKLRFPGPPLPTVVPSLLFIGLPQTIPLPIETHLHSQPFRTCVFSKPPISPAATMTESSTDPAARDPWSSSSASTISGNADSASTGRPNVDPRVASTCRSFSARACARHARCRGGNIKA